MKAQFIVSINVECEVNSHNKIINMTIRSIFDRGLSTKQAIIHSYDESIREKRCQEVFIGDEIDEKKSKSLKFIFLNNRINVDGRLMISTKQVEGKNTSKSNQNVKKKTSKKASDIDREINDYQQFWHLKHQVRI